MEQLDIGAMPICGQDDRLKGMITDRDIVVKALAHDKDPATTKAGELAQDRMYFARAATPIDRALGLMQEHKVKRLPVMDENKRLCGMITEADIAMHMPQETGPARWSARSPPPNRSTSSRPTPPSRPPWHPPRGPAPSEEPARAITLSASRGVDTRTRRAHTTVEATSHPSE